MTVGESIVHMRKGARVRAGMRIVYSDDGAEVPEGASGIVTEIKCGGALVAVEWNPIPTDTPGERRVLFAARWTSFDALEVEKRPAHG